MTPKPRSMYRDVALIGFGEAGSGFASAAEWRASAFDIAPRRRPAMLEAGVEVASSIEEAVARVPLILSLVTADAALQVAEASAPFLQEGALFCDMNSVAPQTKRAAATAVEAAGASYLDVAVMSPVHPARLLVPLLLSGRCGQEGARALAALGFGNLRVVGSEVGRASSIKMIRSVMVKGIEALTAECVIAAQAAGVLDEVLGSLDASEKSWPWIERADYNLDRMMVHGVRRAAEMEQVVATLSGLGTGSMMTRGTVERQRRIGLLGLNAPVPGLEGKIVQISKGGRA